MNRGDLWEIQVQGILWVKPRNWYKVLGLWHVLWHLGVYIHTYSHSFCGRQVKKWVLEWKALWEWCPSNLYSPGCLWVLVCIFSNSLDMFIHKSELDDTCWSRSFHVLLPVMDQVTFLWVLPVSFHFPAQWLLNSTGLHKTLVMCNHDHITDKDADSPRGAAASWGSHRQWEMELESESRSKCSLWTIYQTLKTVESWPGKCWLCKHKDLH